MLIEPRFDLKNMRKYKYCQYCKKRFYMPYGYSYNQFQEVKYCSKKCRVRSLTGRKLSYPVWNKGKTKQGDIKLKIWSDKWSGKNSWKWKGGYYIQRGYKYIYAKNNPNAKKDGYIREHRLIMEQKLGRNLKQKEVIHHIDKNRLNNKINNLMVFKNNAEHIKYHYR